MMDYTLPLTAVRRQIASFARLLSVCLLTAVCVLALPCTGRAQSFEALHSFRPADGSDPNAPPIQASDGNYYGTTITGGAAGYGSLYRITPAGKLTTIASFGFQLGNYPYSGLLQAPDGYLYGTTNSGGYWGYGTVYAISMDGQTSFAVYSFISTSHHQTDGGNPTAGLVLAKDGYLYGTTSAGGTSGLGTVFRISLATWDYQSLYSFTGGNDGGSPIGGLIQAKDGYLYGTTFSGGTVGNGTVYRISTAGAQSVIWNFSGSLDGGRPYCSLIQAADGKLYGTTLNGGNHGFGALFQLTTAGIMNTFYSFTGGSDGQSPLASLVQASDGSLFGAAQTSSGGPGTTFKVTTGLAFVLLYTFTGGSDGAYPYSGMVQGSDGNLYGTTAGGGSFNHGTLYKMTTGGALTTFYSFGGTEGRIPRGGLVQTETGMFYGTTCNGGVNDTGTIYKVDSQGHFTTIYTFSVGSSYSPNADGAHPYGALVEATDGNLYGTCSEGGANGNGTIFRITQGGVFTTIYNFTALNTSVYPPTNADGASPHAGLVQAPDGYLCGTTWGGGGNGRGTYFRVTTGGSFAPLRYFGSSTDGFVNSDGMNPTGLSRGSDGRLYGACEYGGAGYGTVFVADTNGGFNLLHTFNGNDGTAPTGLIMGSDGKYYGTTKSGGVSNAGSVFRIANGVITTLYSFDYSGNSTGDGYLGAGPLCQANDGNLYGATSTGGATNSGTIFRITTAGILTTLYSFSPLPEGSLSANPDGGSPLGGLIQAFDGYLYGVCMFGGTDASGTVFRQSPTIGSPFLRDMSPSTLTVGAAALTLTVNGRYFVPGATVYWNGEALSTTYVSDTQLTAGVPASDLATVGTPSVTATNPGSVPGNPLTFTVAQVIPSLTSLSPSSTKAGGAAFVLTVNGTSFISGAKVYWNGAPLITTFVSSVKLTAKVPALNIAAAGTASVTVANPLGSPSSALPFTTTVGVPTLTSLSPATKAAGSLKFTLAVNGSHFVSGAVVYWNGVALTTTYVSGAKVTAAVPAVDIAAVGTATVKVANPGTAQSNGLTFTTTLSTPKITSLSPAVKLAGDPAFTLTVNGAYFISGAKVRWNGVALTTTYVSGAKLTAAVPATDIAAAGSASITVVNPGTVASNALTLAINNPKPVLSTIAPNSATHGSGALTITLTGKAFLPTSQVRWTSGATVTTLTSSFVSSTSLTATVTAALLATAGTATVQVFNPTPGGGTSAGLVFTIK